MFPTAPSDALARVAPELYVKVYRDYLAEVRRCSKAMEVVAQRPMSPPRKRVRSRAGKAPRPRVSDGVSTPRPKARDGGSPLAETTPMDSKAPTATLVVVPDGPARQKPDGPPQSDVRSIKRPHRSGGELVDHFSAEDISPSHPSGGELVEHFPKEGLVTEDEIFALAAALRDSDPDNELVMLADAMALADVDDRMVPVGHPHAKLVGRASVNEFGLVPKDLVAASRDLVREKTPRPVRDGYLPPPSTPLSSLPLPSPDRSIPPSRPDGGKDAARRRHEAAMVRAVTDARADFAARKRT